MLSMWSCVQAVFCRLKPCVEDIVLLFQANDRWFACAVSLLVLVIWYQQVYILPKVEYNKLHPYTRWAPKNNLVTALLSSWHGRTIVIIRRGTKVLRGRTCASCLSEQV